jgi:hypothetical protein
MDGLLYVDLNVSTDANMPQYVMSATIFVDLNLTDGTALHNRDYAEQSSMTVTVPFKSGTHRVSHPIILLVPGGGMSRTFTIFIASMRAEGSHGKRYVARTGKTSSKIVTITDDSQSMTSASYVANISFTSTLFIMSKLDFYNSFYRPYQLGIGTASSLPSRNVVVTGVIEIGSGIAVKTSIYTSADESTDMLIELSRTTFVQTVSRIMAQNSGTSVSLTTSKAQMLLNCNVGIGAEWVAGAGCRCQGNFFGNGSLLQCQPCPTQANGAMQSFSEPGSTECVVRNKSICCIMSVTCNRLTLVSVLQCPPQYYDADDSPNNVTCLLCASACASRLQENDKVCQVRNPSLK